MEQSETMLEYQRPTGVSVTVLGNGRLGTSTVLCASRHAAVLYAPVTCLFTFVRCGCAMTLRLRGWLRRDDSDTSGEFLSKGGVFGGAQSRGKSVRECGGEHAAYLHESPRSARQAAQSLHRDLHQQGQQFSVHHWASRAGEE